MPARARANGTRDAASKLKWNQVATGSTDVHQKACSRKSSCAASVALYDSALDAKNAACANSPAMLATIVGVRTVTRVSR
ncbi:MAG: hypothetical protein U0841_24280 [Chloroflexia bacterium]